VAIFAEPSKIEDLLKGLPEDREDVVVEPNKDNSERSKL
jgi:hypothetical protein